MSSSFLAACAATLLVLSCTVSSANAAASHRLAVTFTHGGSHVTLQLSPLSPLPADTATDSRSAVLLLNSRVAVQTMMAATGSSPQPAGPHRPWWLCLAPSNCTWHLPAHLIAPTGNDEDSEYTGLVQNVALYAIERPAAAEPSAELLGLTNLVASSPHPQKLDDAMPATAPEHQRFSSTLPNTTAAIGLFYSGWHAYAAQTVTAQTTPQPPITVEQVIQSNGGLTLEDIYQSSTAGDAASFYYQHEPQAGFYCLYRKRRNESTGVLPDCPNIPATARYHAQLLTAAGVDYVALDSTNLPSYSPFADAIQLRPAEVLCEEWFALRQRGVPTPAVAVWATIPTGANLYAYFLSGIYNNANLSTVVARDPATAKMLFFVVENPTMQSDPAILAAIESNGGRNNIICVKMWANFPINFYQAGYWGFMSPCTDQGSYTTAVSDLPACNQQVTVGSSIGNAISVSPSYQLDYGSVPFGGVGKLESDTFRMQWQTAITQAGAVQHIFMSSFNEFIAQPQPNPFPQPYGVSMGLEWDAAKTELWVDSFGCHLARDIEPSVQCGNVTYDMMLSCVRTLTLSQTLFADPVDEDGHTTPLASKAKPASLSASQVVDSVQRLQRRIRGEPCAARANAMESVWSLRNLASTDYLITASAYELSVLLKSGQWSEICNGYSGPVSFCVDGSVLNGRDAPTGPFLLSTLNLNNGGNPLYRCRTSGGTHFFTNQANCEGQILDNFLGYTSGQRSSNFPRSLRRCYTPANDAHYHSLDFPCQAGDKQEADYGFVH